MGLYQCLPAFAATAGAKKPRIVLVGEAWGADESQLRQPFVGSSGKELFLMLGEAMPGIEPELHAQLVDQHRYGLAWVRDRGEWFEAAGIAMTNVLALQPPGNKINHFCVPKKEVAKDYPYPAVVHGGYLREEFLPELDRLIEEINFWQPNLVVALGNTACWALLRATNIGSIRGAITSSNWAGAPVKVLPTYHPAGVLYQWSWRPIVVADLMKAEREGHFSEIRRPQRRVLINPTIEQVESYCDQLKQAADAGMDFLEVGADIETQGGQMVMISFARSKSESVVVPFIDKSKKGWSYWETQQEEERALLAVKRVCEHSKIRIVGQNFIYDMQYLWPLTITFPNVPEDTMMLHHSIYPEMKKGLGFLGSIYTDEASWKLMRTQAPDTEKRDE